MKFRAHGLLTAACFLLIPHFIGCGSSHSGYLSSPGGSNAVQIESSGGSALDAQFISVTVSVKGQPNMMPVFSGAGTFYGKFDGAEPSIRWVSDKHLLIEYTLPQTNSKNCFQPSGDLVVTCVRKGNQSWN